MFHWIILLLLIVSSLSCNFHRCAICFRSFMNIAWRSTQNATRIKCFWRLRIVHKINIISRLSLWSVTLLMFIQTLSSHCKFGASQKWEPAGRIRDFGIFFFNGFAKSPRLPASIVLNIKLVQFVLQNCELLPSVRVLYDKNSTSYSTVSPQMWCIKSIKGWFTHPQICWQEFVK